MLKRAWILSLCIPALLPAALLRIEVSERSDVLEGKAFASAGPYERIVGKAYFAVDPNLIAGLELRGAHLLVGNNWRADLDRLKREIADVG